jgi:hypothetical protein
MLTWHIEAMAWLGPFSLGAGSDLFVNPWPSYFRTALNDWKTFVHNTIRTDLFRSTRLLRRGRRV